METIDPIWEKGLNPVTMLKVWERRGNDKANRIRYNKMRRERNKNEDQLKKVL